MQRVHDHSRGLSWVRVSKLEDEALTQKWRRYLPSADLGPYYRQVYGLSLVEMVVAAVAVGAGYFLSHERCIRDHLRLKVSRTCRSSTMHQTVAHQSTRKPGRMALLRSKLPYSCR